MMRMKKRARSALLFIGSPKVTVAGLLLLAALVVWGTIFQAGTGLYQAQVRIFQSWFFLAGGLLPMPGVLTAGVGGRAATERVVDLKKACRWRCR